MQYDAFMDGRREQLEREEAAEIRRVQREAGRAFDAYNAARKAAPAPVHSAARTLSPARRMQVAHAQAVVAALNGMVYGQVLGSAS